MVVRITIPDPDRRLIRRRHHPVDHRRKNNRCQANIYLNIIDKGKDTS